MSNSIHALSSIGLSNAYSLWKRFRQVSRGITRNAGSNMARSSDKPLHAGAGESLLRRVVNKVDALGYVAFESFFAWLQELLLSFADLAQDVNGFLCSGRLEGS